MKLLFRLILVLGLGFGLSGFSLFNKDEDLIFQKGNRTWVKLRKADKKLGQLDHPFTLSQGQLESALASVHYFRPSAFSLKKDQGKEYELLASDDREFLAPHLSKAFERVTPDRWVDFSLEYFHGQGFIGVYRMTSGVMFVKDGELNIVFREIATSIAPEESVMELNPIRNYSSYVRLVPREGQRLAVTEGRRKQVTHENWIIMPVAALAREQAPAGQTGIATEEPSTEPSPAISPAPASPPLPQAVQKPAKDRMLELRELYDSGLITEEEYQRKRKEILDEL
jgi:hypothetical protein